MTVAVRITCAGELAPAGRVPADLAAPIYCSTCAGTWWATLEQLLDAAAGGAPVVSCCGVRYRPGHLERMALFSRAEWEASGDDDPPPPYRITSAVPLPCSCRALTERSSTDGN